MNDIFIIDELLHEKLQKIMAIQQKEYIVANEIECGLNFEKYLQKVTEISNYEILMLDEILLID